MSDGNRNTGNYNTGDYNTGDCNTGHYNTGNYNTGYRNTGNRNTGNRNTGNYNTGNYNTGNYNTGFFCTETPYATLFDKPTYLTHEQVQNLIPHVDLPIGCEWVPTDKMTAEEKSKFPSHTTTGGFLRSLHMSIQETFLIAWARLDIDTKNQFLSLPNFDADKFLVCTGVDVRLDKDLYPQPEPDVTPSSKACDEIILNGKRYKLVPAE